jgi:hypothetical protein
MKNKANICTHVMFLCDGISTRSGSVIPKRWLK